MHLQITFSSQHLCALGQPILLFFQPERRIARRCGGDATSVSPPSSKTFSGCSQSSVASREIASILSRCFNKTHKAAPQLHNKSHAITFLEEFDCRAGFSADHHYASTTYSPAALFSSMSSSLSSLASSFSPSQNSTTPVDQSSPTVSAVAASTENVASLPTQPQSPSQPMTNRLFQTALPDISPSVWRTAPGRSTGEWIMVTFAVPVELEDLRVEILHFSPTLYASTVESKLTINVTVMRWFTSIPHSSRHWKTQQLGPAKFLLNSPVQFFDT